MYGFAVPVRGFLAFFLMAGLLASRVAWAQAVPVIESGREQEIVSLFEPYKLGGEVVPGVRLMNIKVERTYIEIEVTGADTSAFFRLDHPERSERHDATTASFAVSHGENASGGDAALAVTRLVEALRANDKGKFWRESRALGPGALPPSDKADASSLALPIGLTIGVSLLVIGFMVWQRRKKKG